MKRARRLFRARSAKEGLPPGTLVHIGEASQHAVAITRFSFSEQELREERECDLAALTPEQAGSRVTWIDVEGVHEVETIRSLGESYSLHPLVLEDIVSTVQRPKVEDYDDYLFLVARMLLPQEGRDFSVEQVSMVLGRGWLFTFQEGFRGDVFESVRERLRSGKGRIRAQGADYLAYALLDTMVDRYFTVLEQFGERLVLLEEEVSLHPHPRLLVQLNELKKEAIFLRKTIWPLREVLSFLQRDDTELINETTRIYLRDVHDHAIQAIETVETYRDLLSGMQDLYLSSIANRTNEIMRFLTVIGTIFIPLTFIVGLYGMNFKYMPELEWHWGYFGVLLLMAVIALGMVEYFRRRRWL
ncbi:magnesium/cobalt transporter CorA [Trichlorobacter ammonificans]|uniref:Magnesium transport protein CorA n=1 Tax=Trichlorobacter ammonificans TaxID=2916410 RepID=A0ABM9D8L9_9BACT|nr:magnesium/cobalt transporter CorA [Trichlorobacter ammonificans]CAH2031562.1 Cobalt/magnesium transport protein CorA [Trichlorobacter ammonificans]